jgi:hypothetical protein
MDSTNTSLQTLVGGSTDPATGRVEPFSQAHLEDAVQALATTTPATEALIDMDLALSSPVIGELLDTEVREELDKRRLEELSRLGKLATHD